MSNIDFLTVPLGTYLKNHFKFGKRLKNSPKVFAVNYFLKYNGKYCNEKVDKKIWVLWAEGRVHGEYDALKTPMGYLPRYKDLAALFRLVFNRDYAEGDYELQFSIRVDRLLEKTARVEETFGSEPDIPRKFWAVHNQLKAGLVNVRAESGRSVVPPSFFR